MSGTDTSAGAVEHLAKRLKRDIDWRPNSLCAESAATLRALAAERDGLAALVDRMGQQDIAAIKQWQAANPGNELIWPDQTRLTAWCMGEVAKANAQRDAALAECERLRLGGCARGQTTTQWCAEAVQMMDERDATRAEVTRLREALEIIAGRRQCADNLLGNEDVAAIALAKEPHHD